MYCKQRGNFYNFSLVQEKFSVGNAAIVTNNFKMHNYFKK
ncbi:hypothetical protein QE417_004130 [Mucilaginibacter terrae]|uniref:Uncharacterized protein n=1 Tax=Mucilaginibacter terrae TaxID=1955052 RepID=A0ABU3GZ73_9SPHI|nr:hypothetical protein [Mucilaginibacter terrae]